MDTRMETNNNKLSLMEYKLQAYYAEVTEKSYP